MAKRPAMNKRDITTIIAQETGFAQIDVKLVVEKFMEVISRYMGRGHEIELRDFARFSNRIYKGRRCRDINNPEIFYDAESRRVPVIRLSKKIRESVRKLPV